MGCQCMSTQASNEKTYAGFFVRLAAYLVDVVIAWFISFAVKVPIWCLGLVMDDNIFNKEILFDKTLTDIVGYLAFVAYFVLCTYFAHKTLGKKLFKLEVISVSDNWTFINILYRETIGRFLTSFLCIGYIVLMVDKEKCGFHDMLSDTRVIYAVTVKKIEKIKKVYENPVPTPVGVNNINYNANQGINPQFNQGMNPQYNQGMQGNMGMMPQVRPNANPVPYGMQGNNGPRLNMTQPPEYYNTYEKDPIKQEAINGEKQPKLDINNKLDNSRQNMGRLEGEPQPRIETNSNMNVESNINNQNNANVQGNINSQNNANAQSNVNIQGNVNDPNNI